MSFGKCKRERVELRKRKAFAAKSMHPKASFGTQIEERKYNSVLRSYCTYFGQAYNCRLAHKSRKWIV
jgi:hypothetical protein